MIRFYALLTGLVLTYFIYGVYVSQAGLQIIPTEIKRDHPPGFYDYRGAINVQTNFSLGLSSPTEVIEEARLADLDFMIMTDVNQFQSAELYNGYYGNLFVMSEAEYSFLDARILYIGENSGKTFDNPAEAHLFLTDLLSQRSDQSRDGLAILAHPFLAGKPTWTGPYPSGLHGLEILNPKSISSNVWQASKLDVFWSLVVYPFNSRYAFLRLFREPTEETVLWDRLNTENFVNGFAGSDANARALPLANYLVRFPTYQRSLSLANNHILLSSELTGHFQKDRQKIIQALRNGNFYFSLDILADPKGFNALLIDREQTHLMGSKVPFRKGQIIEAKISHPPNDFYEIVLWKDGQREHIVNAPELRYEIEGPGVYRIQVRVSPLLPVPDGKRWISWIYSNPFFVLKK